jgi:hypothetical protein
MPKKQVVGTVWHLSTWHHVQCTTDGALVIYASRSNTALHFKWLHISPFNNAKFKVDSDASFISQHIHILINFPFVIQSSFIKSGFIKLTFALFTNYFVLIDFVQKHHVRLNYFCYEWTPFLCDTG